MSLPTKLVYLSSIAAPHQLRLAEQLREHFDAQFWFYEHTGQGRPAWWKLPLPENCRVLDGVRGKSTSRYYCKNLVQQLAEWDPDVVMLGGFLIPSNYLAYRWAKQNGKKVVVFTETFRTQGQLRGKSLASRLIAIAYSKIDALFTCHANAAHQMREVLPRLKERTHTARYAADIDDYFNHPTRNVKEGYTYLFPNRLTEDYNPLLAIDIFHDIQRRYPASQLRMNPQGELHAACQRRIEELGLERSAKFLSDIKSWDEMPQVYRDADILLFPAKFSNGNLTILECMASGMGIIVSDQIQGQTDLISQGKGGFVCRAERSEFLVAIQQYIDNPSLLVSHAKINRELVRPLSAAGTAKLYAALIHQHVLCNATDPASIKAAA